MEVQPRGSLQGPQLVWEFALDHAAAPLSLSLARTSAQKAQRQAGHAGPHYNLAPLTPSPTTLQQHRPQPKQQPQRRQQQQQGGSAAQLNAQLSSQAVQHSPTQLRDAVLGSTGAGDVAVHGAGAGAAPGGLARRLSGLVVRAGDILQPQGEAPGDATWPERAANVLTCLPFFAVGWNMHRQRLTPEGRHHARSMMGVGLAATLYHATSGATRRWARKLDYWTIAYSSSAMLKCLYADTPAALRAADLSLLAVPFKPFAVSLGSALVMQGEFARQARQNKAVRADLKRHYAAAALGLGAFFAEDLVMDSGFGGFVHAAWHCLAAYGCHTMNGLLSHKERLHLQRQLSSDASSAGAKPLRRPLHSSASSLPSCGSIIGSGKDDWSSGFASP